MESDSDHSQVILGPKLEKKLPKMKMSTQESTLTSKEDVEEYDDLESGDEDDEDEGEEDDDIELGEDEDHDLEEEGEEESEEEGEPEEEDLEGYDEEQPEDDDDEDNEEEDEFVKEKQLKSISPKKDQVKEEEKSKIDSPSKIQQQKDKVKTISPKQNSSQKIQNSPTVVNSSITKSNIIPIQESFVKDSMIQYLIDPEKALTNPLSTLELQNQKNKYKDTDNGNSRNNSKNPSPKLNLNNSNSTTKSNNNTILQPLRLKSSPLKSPQNNDNIPDTNKNKIISPKTKLTESNSKIDICAILGSQKSVKSITVSEEEYEKEPENDQEEQEKEEEQEEQEEQEEEEEEEEEEESKSITTERKPLRNFLSESRKTSLERTQASNKDSSVSNSKSQKKKSTGNISKLIATLGKEREVIDKSRKAQINNAKKIKKLTKNLKKERKQLIQDQKKQEEVYKAKLEREKALEKAKLEEESSELVIEEKEYILHELWKYEKLGYKPRKKLSMKHTLRQLRFELYRIKQSEKLENRVNNAYDMFDSVNAGIELLNVKWKPFGIELTGWSDTVGTQEDEYKRILRKMFRYYEFEFIDRPMVQFGLRLGTQFIGFVAPRIIEKLTGTVQVDKSVSKKEPEKESKQTIKMMEAIINNQTQAQEFNKQLAAILVSQQKSMSTLEEKMQSLSTHTVYQMQQQPVMIKDSRVEELESYTKKNPLSNFDTNQNKKQVSDPTEETKSIGKKIAEDDEWEYYEVEDDKIEEQYESQSQPNKIQNVNIPFEEVTTNIEAIAEIPKPSVQSVLNSPFGMFTSHPALSKLSNKLNRIKNGKPNETELPESDSNIQLPEKFKTNAVATSVINL